MLDESRKRLFAPVKIGPFSLKHRIIVRPARPVARPMA
jgi:2,4-dienoyl-CoA reductase-like NADH-dependent reductase (Old Yellow Enzyme family)